MLERLRARRGDEGASSVEYGLVVFAIAATLVVSIFALGPPVFDLYDGTCTAFQSEIKGTATNC